MKEITKTRAEINEIETRTTIEQINKTMSCFFLKNKLANFYYTKKNSNLLIVL